MIPDYQSIMLPLLKFSSDKKEHSITEAVQNVSKAFNLTAEEMKQLLPSGKQAIVENRVGWALTYLKKALLLESTKRAYFRVTQRGLEVLAENPPKINVRYLERFPELKEFIAPKKEKTEDNSQAAVLGALDPKEMLENAYQTINDKLAHDLMTEIMNASDAFFEKLVVQLIVKMGYGGSIKDAGMAIGRTGDGGIDGIINEDKLGLDKVYIQAKHWAATAKVSRPEIQKFIGALHERQASKGIFITTSSFTKEAEDCAMKVPSPKVVLIDGSKLVQYMIESDVGVSEEDNYKVKRIDSDFFSEE